MVIMTMDVEMNPQVGEESPMEENTMEDSQLDSIIKHLTLNPSVVFKSQQRGEADLTNQEKIKLAHEIFEQNKFNFLSRFGKHLAAPHLEYFQQFARESEEVELILKNLQHSAISHTVDVKNRRYEALLRMVEEGKYFSDVEMMKRNPLLYEQLVGQYLTDEEKRVRDRENMYKQETFVRILMEGIERDNAELKRRAEKEREEEAMEESDSDDEYDTKVDINSTQPSYSQWGEYHDAVNTKISKKSTPKVPYITAEERTLLKEEFITSMYQSFLDGKDEDFDYETVDNNEGYDNTDIVDHDEEDKYFDSEEPADVKDDDKAESSEDELDIYMSALNNHPAVARLTDDIKKL